MKTILLIALLPLLLAASCKKDKLADELSKLPPATQTGANTFGCLVNGKAWVPQGGCFLCPSVLKFYYDSGNGGQFSIKALLTNAKRDEGITITVDSIISKKSLNLKLDRESARVLFRNSRNSPTCYSLFSDDFDLNCEGLITLTTVDLTTMIISGTFEFTLFKQSCETITITNGRFDAKL
jgi:hypothetical protein